MPLEEFYQKQNEPLKSCFLAMRSIVLNFDENFNKAIKYGLPCFLYKGKICLYLWKDKKTNNPYFLFADGKLLTHPELEAGDRKRMKDFKVNASEDLPIQTIYEILIEAVELKKI